jgi:hypothetical protein
MTTYKKRKERKKKSRKVKKFRKIRGGGLFDAFYTSFEKDDDQKNEDIKAELESAIHNSLLEILYFPSASKSFGKTGKVEKKNVYGDFAILNSNPQTSFIKILKKNIRKSEDFIANILQGREGDPHIKPIFREKIFIKDKSEFNEIIKENNKREDKKKT